MGRSQTRSTGVDEREGTVGVGRVSEARLCERLLRHAELDQERGRSRLATDDVGDRLAQGG